MKIDHFAMEVSDLEASIGFYTALGFKEQVRFTDENEHESLAILGMEGGKLELIQALSERNEPQSFEPPLVRPHFCPHLALCADDLEATRAELAGRGIAIVHGPLEVAGAAKWLYICDPDGNVVEFFQDLSFQG